MDTVMPPAVHSTRLWALCGHYAGAEAGSPPASCQAAHRLLCPTLWGCAPHAFKRGRAQQRFGPQTVSKSEICHSQGEVGWGGILQGRAWLASPPRSRSSDGASVVLGLWGTPGTGPAPSPPLGPLHEWAVSVVMRRPQTAESSVTSHGWACPQWHPRSSAKGPSPDYSAHGIRDSARTHLVTHPLFPPIRRPPCHQGQGDSQHGEEMCKHVPHTLPL